MNTCERCGKEHDGSYGSGRFCSKSCANARDHSDETKKKISNTLKAKALTKYDNGVTTKKEHERLLKQERVQSFLDTVQSSDDMRIVRYDGIDFGDNYVVTRYGDVISVRKQRKLTISKRVNYSCVHMSDTSGKSPCLYLHRVVALNFIPNPNNYPIINHKDQDPSNNNADNLEWCTYLYNNTYGDAMERRINSLKETIRRNGGAWNKGMKMK